MRFFVRLFVLLLVFLPSLLMLQHMPHVLLLLLVRMPMSASASASADALMLVLVLRLVLIMHVLQLISSSTCMCL